MKKKLSMLLFELETGDGRPAPLDEAESWRRYIVQKLKTEYPSLEITTNDQGLKDILLTGDADTLKRVCSFVDNQFKFWTAHGEPN